MKKCRKYPNLIVIFLASIMTACQPSSILDLSEKDSLWYKDGSLFTGKAYGTSKIINNKPIYRYFGLFNFGDSLLLNIQNGKIKIIDFYTSHGHFAKQEFLEDSLTQLEFYYTEPGIWDEKLISGTASFKNGKPHGLRMYYAESKHYMYYNNGKLERQTEYKLEPKLLDIDEILAQEIIYKKGNSNARFTRKYYDNGKTLREESDIDSDGNVLSKVSYDLNGKIYEKVVNGKKIVLPINGSIKTSNSRGEIRVMVYKNGKKHGVERQYYTDGQLWVETTYNNGDKNGLNKRWYKNGELALECTYHKNTIHGNYQKWYDNGQLWEKSTYQNAKLISQNKWYKDGKPALK